MSLIGPSPYTTCSRYLVILVEMKHLNKKMVDTYVSGTVLGDL